MYIELVITKFIILQFLNFLQARAREFPKTGHSGQTITLMLVGIPNVGKSALVNALHQIGRISAAGKLILTILSILLFIFSF